MFNREIFLFMRMYFSQTLRGLGRLHAT